MAVPSPICTVKDGSGSPLATTNGNDVTPGNTVTIAIAATAGVDVWTLTCIGTDETSVAATVTSGLTINQTTKSATFTAPAAGKSYLFRSTVRSSGSSESYSATFKVCTLTSGGLRVAALGETVENSASYGWTSIVNSGVRGSGSSAFVSVPVLYMVNLTTEMVDIAWGPSGFTNTSWDESVDFNAEASSRPATREVIVAFKNGVGPTSLTTSNQESGCILTLVDGDGGAGTNSIAYTSNNIRGGDTVTLDTAWAHVRMIWDGTDSRWHVLGFAGCTFS